MNIRPIVILAVVVTLLGSLLLPVLNDAQYGVSDEVNNVGANFTTINEDDNFKMTFENVSGSTNLIDGVSRNLVSEFGSTVWIVSDDITIRIGSDNRTSFVTEAHSMTLSPGDKISFEDGTVTIDTADYDSTTSYSRLFMPDKSGDFGAFYGLPAHVDNNQEIFMFAPALSGDSYHWVGEYNFKTGFKILSDPVTIVANSDNVPFDGDLTVTVNPDVGDLSSYISGWDDFTITVTPTEGESTSTTPNDLFYIVPLVYHVPTDDQNQQIKLLYVLPVLIIAATLIALVRANRY